MIRVILDRKFGFDVLSELGCDNEVASKKIRNARRKFIKSQDQESMPSYAETFEGAIQFLSDHGYICSAYSWKNEISNIERHGFAFVFKDVISTFKASGYLVLMDATHHLAGKNDEGKLTTVYVKSKHGSWFPGGQFWMEREDSSGVGAGLKAIKNIVNSIGPKKWEPRYFVIDQSHIEMNGIKMAFKGIPNRGERVDCLEQNVSIFFCKVHVMRTWIRRIGQVQSVLQGMIKAMHKKTLIGAQMEVDNAIRAAQTKQMKDYIAKNWFFSLILGEVLIRLSAGLKLGAVTRNCSCKRVLQTRLNRITTF